MLTEGKLTLDQFFEAMSIPGTKFSGSDWKYGWPHKYYIEPLVDGKYLWCKFYNTELLTATHEEVKRFSKISEKFFSISWIKDEKGVKSIAIPNMQLWGVVGEDLEPDYSSMKGVNNA